jgi:hypothetical protein
MQPKQLSCEILLLRLLYEVLSCTVLTYVPHSLQPLMDLSVIETMATDKSSPAPMESVSERRSEGLRSQRQCSRRFNGSGLSWVAKVQNLMPYMAIGGSRALYKFSPVNLIKIGTIQYVKEHMLAQQLCRQLKQLPENLTTYSNYLNK